MDALSDVLRFLRLTGGVFLDAEFSAPWCVISQIRPEDWAPSCQRPPTSSAITMLLMASWSFRPARRRRSRSTRETLSCFLGMTRTVSAAPSSAIP